MLDETALRHRPPAPSGEFGSWPQAEAAAADVPAAVGALAAAAQVVLEEDPTPLPGPVALGRLQALLAVQQAVDVAVLSAVRDLDARSLWALDGAGSSRCWLRQQTGGNENDLTLARRLGERPQVDAASRAGEVSVRAAGQLCAALELLPDELDDEVVRSVLEHGIGGPTGLLATATGGQAPDAALSPEVRSRREQAQSVLDACVADTTSAPADRLEPALVLLARLVDSASLGPGLRLVTDALRPDAADAEAERREKGYYLDLVEVMDGAGDVRGHVDPVTLALFRRLIEVRERGPVPDEAAAAGGPAPPDDGVPAPGTRDVTADDTPDEADERPGGRADAAGRPIVEGEPRGLLGTGQRRYHALKQLLADAAAAEQAGVEPGLGSPPQVELLLVAAPDALAGAPGAMPATLDTRRGSIPVRPSTLQRMACAAAGVSAVLRDAEGRPVGASGTHRHATRRERRTLRAQWGPRCAVRGCRNRATIPHHVIPWWLVRRTRLADLVPLCEHHHRDVHDGHRTLRLRDARLIDEHGWVEIVQRE